MGYIAKIYPYYTEGGRACLGERWTEVRVIIIQPHSTHGRVSGMVGKMGQIYPRTQRVYDQVTVNKEHPVQHT